MCLLSRCKRENNNLHAQRSSLAVETVNVILPFERFFLSDPTKIAKTRTGNGIGSETDCANATGTVFASGIARGIDMAEDRAAAIIKVDGKEITEVAAETDRTEIGAGNVIVTETDIGIGNKKKTEQRNSKIFFYRPVSDMYISVSDIYIYIYISISISIYTGSKG